MEIFAVKTDQNGLHLPKLNEKQKYRKIATNRYVYTRQAIFIVFRNVFRAKTQDRTKRGH